MRTDWRLVKFRFRKRSERERDVFDSQTGEFLGVIFKGWSNTGQNRGWMYDHNCTPQGTMTGAARAMLRYEQTGKR